MYQLLFTLHSCNAEMLNECLWKQPEGMFMFIYKDVLKLKHMAYYFVFFTHGRQQCSDTSYVSVSIGCLTQVSSNCDLGSSHSTINLEGTTLNFSTAYME